MMSFAKLPFLIHILVASCSALTFIFRPHRQLQPLSHSAAIILQCYGGCILFTNLISLIFLVRPVVDETTKLVALAFAFCHAWPSYRAVTRLQNNLDVQGELGNTLGGPIVHLGVHGLLLFMFLQAGLL
jgi:hypothetical protein